MNFRKLIPFAICLCLLSCGPADRIEFVAIEEHTNLSIHDLENNGFVLIPGEESLYEIIKSDTLIGVAFNNETGLASGQYWNIRLSRCLIKSDVEKLLLSYGVSVLAYAGYDSSTFYAQNMHTRNYYRCISSSVGDTCFLSVHFEFPTAYAAGSPANADQLPPPLTRM